MRRILPLGLGLFLSGMGMAFADTVFVMATNNVPVAMVEASRAPTFTLVRLQTQTALQRVCWTSNGADSPYLLASGHRYRYLGGDNVTPCPTRRDYAQGEVMVLRFEPLDSQAHEFALVEGQGGENQMIQPGSSKVRYWNFLRVPLK